MYLRAMIKKNDLVKQFELLSLQEIKNHNDIIYNTNQTLNSIKVEIENNKKEFKDYILNIAECLKYLEIRLDRSVESLKTKDTDLNALCDESMNLNLRNNKEIMDLDFLFRNQDKRLDKFEESLNKVSLNQYNLEINYQRLKEEIKSDLEIIKNKLKDEMIAFKNEILNLPDKAQKVKDELTEKMNIDRVNFTGLMREIEVLKKNDFVIEKNIENLYTQLKRLKGGDS